MRLCSVFAQSCLLFYICCTCLAMTSPWLVPGGGAVWLRALLLQLYLEHMGWIFGIPFAACALWLFAMLFCAYALGIGCARAGGVLIAAGMLIMCLLAQAPRVPTGYALACAAAFLPRPAKCRISRNANRRLQHLLWAVCLVPGIIAWVYPWPECALLLPGGLAMFFIFRFLAKGQDRIEALIPGALASLGLGLTMPPLAFFCALGCLGRLLTAKAPCTE